MKKRNVVKFIVLPIVLAILLVGGIVWSQGLQTSGVKTSSGVIVPGPCLFYGVEIITDGTNPATVIIYDNATAASGTQVFTGTVAGNNNFGGILNAFPVNMTNGIYLGIAGTAASAIVYSRAK
jgi:hypothetical protein